MYSQKQNEYYKKYRKDNVLKIREYNRKCYQKYKKERDLRVKNYQNQAKIDVFNYYSNGSNACSCCGIQGIAFLTIDHIKGDGAKLRKSKIHKTGVMFYMWLRTNKYPEGFQVLCYNCNQAKRQLPICPHKLIKE